MKFRFRLKAIKQMTDGSFYHISEQNLVCQKY